MVLGPSPAELTDAGFLAPARVLAPPGPSLQGLRKRMGDFDMRQASEMLGSGQAMGSPLAHYRQHLDGRTAIAFCCSVAHAEAVAQLFNDHGIAAASIDGTMDSATREQLLADLGAGRLKVLTSCSLIGEGVDVPSVAGCILLRPTQSVSLHLQMIGRCLRPQDGKQAVILDHVGNTQRLGHHLEEREWSLEGTPKKDREKAPSVKVCPSCFSAMPSAKPICPDCGHQFVPERRELEHVEGELVEVSRIRVGDQVIVRKTMKSVAALFPGSWKVTDINSTGTAVLKKDGSHKTARVHVSHLIPDPRAGRTEQATATTLEQLIDVGKRRGMKNPRGWARHVLAARQTKGHWSRVA
jgi:superfamily II DNA or RNA helicase